MRELEYSVGGDRKSAHELTIEDLEVLYNTFIAKIGAPPHLRDCKLANNLPTPKRIYSILDKYHMSYKDFLKRFDRVDRVRASVCDYNRYKERFISLSMEIGHAPTKTELTKNCLPTSSWFVKNCPCDSVSNYVEFVNWCGLIESKHVWTKQEVDEVLVGLDRKLRRRIKKSDIKPDKTGFSMIVVNRIYGSLGNAIRELGLNQEVQSNRKSIDYYKGVLADVVLDYIKKTGCRYITWRDIESGKYGAKTYNHKAFIGAFSKYDENLRSFVKGLGCQFNPSLFSSSYTFQDGEMVRSKLEYEMSRFLKDIGLKYNYDYFRDVKYNKYFDIHSKIDCDYVFVTEEGNKFIEVAGIIDPCSVAGDCEWYEKEYASINENKYRDTMYEKMKLFNANKSAFMILFPNDIYTDIYKQKLCDFIRVDATSRHYANGTGGMEIVEQK